MSKQQFAPAVVWGTAAVLTILLGRNLWAYFRGVPAVTIMVPHTVRRVETWFGQDGSRRNTSTQVSALRSDGAMVLRTDTLRAERPGARTVRRTLALPSGESIQTEDLKQWKSSAMADPRAEFRNRYDPGTRCTRTFNERPTLGSSQRVVGTESILGVEAVVIERGNTTAWYAPSLSCALLRLRVKFPEGTSEQLATEVIMGDPEAALFDIAASYAEISPAKFAGRDPREPGMKRREEYYYAHRPQVAVSAQDRKAQ